MSSIWCTIKFLSYYFYLAQMLISCIHFFLDALLADLQNTISPPPPAPSGRVTPNYSSLNGSLSRGDYATINSTKSDRSNSSRLTKSPPSSVSIWFYLFSWYHHYNSYDQRLFHTDYNLRMKNKFQLIAD